jgi:hypothetical protein|tara:strand:+ start:920 stop:1174 length:255 start_codon:yes stop_codon:yes gene_type:complete
VDQVVEEVQWEQNFIHQDIQALQVQGITRQQTRLKVTQVEQVVLLVQTLLTLQVVVEVVQLVVELMDQQVEKEEQVELEHQTIF